MIPAPRRIPGHDLVVPLALAATIATAGAWSGAKAGATPSASGAPRVVSVSPVPGARLVLPATTLAVRFDRAVAPGSAGVPGTIAVTGSVSGPHPGRVVLSDDGRTLVFRPDRGFAPGERVTVELGTATTGRPGLLGDRGSFGFEIAKAAPPPLPSSLALECQSASPPPLFADPALGRMRAQSFPAIATALYGTPAAGRLFLSNLSFGPPAIPYLLILNDDGTPIFFREMESPCTDFKPQPDGRLTYFDIGRGAFYALDSSYAVVDSFRCGNGYTTDLHELRLLPDGHALLMSYDPQVVDMSQIVAGGDTAAAVIGLVVQELDTDRNVVFQWRSWDHFEISDALHEDMTAAIIDYVHGNAIEHEKDGNLLISSRHLDEITKIDRETGEILWRWGGKNNQFTFIDDSLEFSHQHAIRRLPNGHVLLYDNGNFHDPPFSRAVEYQLDEVARTARLEWKYRNDPDTYGFAMGYCQRLDNGNTLISWGAGKPDLTEVAPDGTRVMDLWLPPGIFSYRAFRAEWDHVVAGVPAPVPRSSLEIALAPNPARGRFELSADLPVPAEVSLEVYDLQGRAFRSVLEHASRPAGRLRVPVDLSQAPAGIYWCRFEVGAAGTSRKVLILP